MLVVLYATVGRSHASQPPQRHMSWSEVIPADRLYCYVGVSSGVLDLPSRGRTVALHKHRLGLGLEIGRGRAKLGSRRRAKLDGSSAAGVLGLGCGSLGRCVVLVA